MLRFARKADAEIQRDAASQQMHIVYISRRAIGETDVVFYIRSKGYQTREVKRVKRRERDNVIRGEEGVFMSFEHFFLHCVPLCCYGARGWPNVPRAS